MAAVLHDCWPTGSWLSCLRFFLRWSAGSLAIVHAVGRAPCQFGRGRNASCLQSFVLIGLAVVHAQRRSCSLAAGLAVSRTCASLRTHWIRVIVPCSCCHHLLYYPSTWSCVHPHLLVLMPAPARLTPVPARLSLAPVRPSHAPARLSSPLAHLFRMALALVPAIARVSTRCLLYLRSQALPSTDSAPVAWTLEPLAP